MNFKEKITEEQLKILKDNVRNKEMPESTKNRIQAILLLEEGLASATLKTITGYQREVIVKFRRKFIEYGLEALKPKRKEKAPKFLLTRSQKANIVNILNTSKPSDYGIPCDFWTSGILGRLIEEQYGVKYKSKTTMYLIFKQAKFTFRKPEKRSEKYNEKRIEDWKDKYKSIIEEECSRQDTVVLVGDEAAISSETRLQRVWLPLEGLAFVQDTANKKTLHMYGFLNIQTGEAHAFKATGQNSETTVDILKKLTKKYPNKRIVIFWDNASWHKSQFVREYLATKNPFKLYNFPPYSPELNPQEHVWKEVRDKIINNKFITDIDKTLCEAIDFIESSLFKYRFFGVHGTFNV